MTNGYVKIKITIIQINLKVVLKVKIINSLSDFINKVSDFDKSEYFYRGEDRLFEKRSPSIYQYPKLLENSPVYYNRLLAELPNSDDATPFETLSRLQHYGAKTRMLDITSNPLIALFFACISSDEDGFVYVYKSNNVKFETGHTAIMKAAVNFIPNKIVKDFIEKEEDKDAEYKFLTKLNEEVGIHTVYNDAKKIRDDLTKAHIIIAKKQTSRISRQSGNFIIPAYEIDEINVNKSIESLSAKDIAGNFVVFKISKLNKKTILQELSKLGIHEGSVYPDVENQTKYLIRFFEDFPVKIDNSKNNEIKEEIKQQYKKGKVIFSHLNIFDLNDNYENVTSNLLDFLQAFHTEDSTMIVENDNYFVGLRADHFVVEVGYSEFPLGDDKIDQKYAIITANHKGTRRMTGVRLNKFNKPTTMVSS